MEQAGCTPAVGHGDAGSFVAERLKRFDICLYQAVSRPFYKHDFQHRLNMFLCPLKTRTAFIKLCISTNVIKSKGLGSTAASHAHTGTFVYQ
jgi:hypothetical protein